MPTTLVAIRIPEELLEKIDAEGKRSTVIVKRLQGSYGDPLFVPANPASGADVKAAQAASRIATRHSQPPYDRKTVAPPLTASALPPVGSIYTRPKHNPTCKCLTCRP